MIRKLAKCIGEFKKETILTPVFVGFECAFDVIIPFLMAFLIDNGINKGDTKTVISIGILLIIQQKQQQALQKMLERKFIIMCKTFLLQT